MISDALQKNIPSRSYVQYLNVIGHKFTDFEEAGILYHVITDQELKMEELRKLAERTQDAGLKEQLKAWIMHESDPLAKFRDNSAGNAVYVVHHADKNQAFCIHPGGSAADYETAYAIGLSTRSRFTITKKGMNSASEYPNDILTFNSKGRLVDHYISNKDKSALDIMERQYPGKMFYNSFIEFPFPFGGIGDFVRYVDNSDEEVRWNIGWESVIGIVDESCEQYERYLDRDEKTYMDISNARIYVQFMNEDGRFTSWHVLPVFLERAIPDEEADWFELAMSAQGVISGEGSLASFLAEYDKLRSR